MADESSCRRPELVSMSPCIAINFMEIDFQIVPD
jgi:hypothetical protein